MGNCCLPVGFCRRSSAIEQKKVTLLLAGLDNAGKTTIAKRLSDEPLNDVLPTVGFSKVSLMEKGCHVTIYDLGGGSQIRDIWPRYYPDVHGVIFVVDASDIARLSECRKVLEGLLLHKFIAGKPILLLANKQDIEGALDEIDIVDRLNVERLVNQQKCPTLVELCSARNFIRKKDIGISNGYKWLLRSISKEYPFLNDRVLKDHAMQEELERTERIQKENRVKKYRQEWELEIGRKLLSTVNQNGIAHMAAGIPGQVEDTSDESNTSIVSEKFAAQIESRAAQPLSQTCEFFKEEEENFADMILLQNLDEKWEIKNFLTRPKSSEPRLSIAKLDFRQLCSKRRHFKRHNKIGPSPLMDIPAETVKSPSVFDRSTYADSEKNSEAAFAEEFLKKIPSKSAPNSRKASAKLRPQRPLSGELVTTNLSKLEKFPPLRITRGSLSKGIIIDVTKLEG